MKPASYLSFLHYPPLTPIFLVFLLICGSVAGSAANSAADPANGIFGITVTISADGVFNPTIQKAEIVEVIAGLPAAKAGLAIGDEVLEVDGQRIPGATAKELAPLTKGKKVGSPVGIVLKRPDGQSYTVTLIAVARPHE